MLPALDGPTRVFRT